MDADHKTRIVEIWKSIVEVQRHFNDISMRIRGMFVTIIVALFASIGFLAEKDIKLTFDCLEVRFITLIPLIGIFASWLFYFMDRYWYHRLLVGSVKHAIEIENNYKDDIPELSLSAAIGRESPYNPGIVLRLVALIVVGDRKFKETGQLHSDGKIEIFYKSVMLVLFLICLLTIVLGGSSWNRCQDRKVESPPLRILYGHSQN